MRDRATGTNKPAKLPKCSFFAPETVAQSRRRRTGLPAPNPGQDLAHARFVRMSKVLALIWAGRCSCGVIKHRANRERIPSGQAQAPAERSDGAIKVHGANTEFAGQ